MAWALVTGASAGIGRELAICCARDYDLILTARREAPLKELAQSLEANGRKTKIVICDLGAPGGPAELARACNGLEVEVLINNAGFGLAGCFAELPMDRQTGELDILIRALTELSRLFLPAMIARRKGYILNVASTAAFQPGPFMAVYCASKAYVLSFSLALNEEMRGTGVTVTALCPGATDSEFATVSGASPKLFGKHKTMTAGKVARMGYIAMKKGKGTVITGLKNRLMAFSTRLAPRSFTARMAANILRP
jgi:short-subunit dehydrogenase